MDGEPALGELLAGAEGLLRELLREEELLDDEELLEGIELLLVGIWADGGWLLVEVVLQPPISAARTTGRSSRGCSAFTASTCTCR